LRVLAWGVVVLCLALVPGAARGRSLTDILLEKGVITPQEAKQIQKGGAAAAPAGPAEQKLIDILVQKGVITPAERAEAVGPSAPAAAVKVAAPEAEEKAAVTEKAAADPLTFRAYWKEGLRFENADKSFKMRIGGRLQLDTAIFAPSQNLQSEFDIDSFQSGVEFRRARLYTEGVIYKDFGWKFEYDFADQAFKDVYFEVNHVPYVEQVRLGFFKEPLSFEELTSDNFTTFMERGLPNAFSPSRKTGFQTQMNFLDNRIYWAAGGFNGASNNLGKAFGDAQDYELTTRLAGLPWYADEANLLYVGLGYSHQFRSNFDLAYSSRPEAHLVDVLIDTDDFQTDGVDILDPAAALVLGPFSAQAEYIQTLVQGTEGAEDPRFFGWYAFVSYFPTGEHRGYEPETATFGRVYPKRNFGFSSGDGWGALEVALRQSQLNLNSAGIDGGRLNDTTFGLTWYLNPNMRIMANYVYANRTPPSSGNVYQARFQVDY
jgi:phosphate-selective porin OprO and OprP